MRRFVTKAALIFPCMFFAVQGGAALQAAVLQGGAEGARGAISTAYERRSGYVYTPRDPELYTYDADGNLLSDGTWNYTWDAENRLIGMENTADYFGATGSKQKLAFVYDDIGRRVEKKVWDWNAATSEWELTTHHRFLYDGWNVIAQLDGMEGNAVRKTFTWGQDVSGTLDGAGGVGGLLDVQDYGIWGSSFYVYDHNGNVVGLTGYFGGYDCEYAYEPFGATLYDNPIYSGVTQDNPFRFSTKYLDFETGLYYYGHRYYNPDIGRFISRDPIEEEGGVNLYAFVENQPITRWDLLGMAKDCWELPKSECYCYLSITIDPVGENLRDEALEVVNILINEIPLGTFVTNRYYKANFKVIYKETPNSSIEKICTAKLKNRQLGGFNGFLAADEFIREIRAQTNKLKKKFNCKCN